MRPLAHRGGVGWYAAKVALGGLHCWQLTRQAKTYGAGKARRTAAISIGLTLAMATSNSIQIAISR